MIIMVIACLEPEHDNVYDPENPDKAHISGTVRGYEWDALADARVILMQDTSLIDETTSDQAGLYEFFGVDPGVYHIAAVAGYYRPMETDEFGVTAGADIDTADVYFQEIYFHFDGEEVGTEQPRGWDILIGAWEIIEDMDEPYTHSAPNVYNGSTDGFAPAAVAVFENGLENFSLGTELKVLPSSSPGWETGLVLRYGDQDNFYQFAVGADHIVFRRIENGVSTNLGLQSANIEPGDYYYVCAECYDANITVWFEDAIIFEIEDATFGGGSAGLWAYSPAGTTSVNFDDIVIWP